MIVIVTLMSVLQGKASGMSFECGYGASAFDLLSAGLIWIYNYRCEDSWALFEQPARSHMLVLHAASGFVFTI